MPTAAAVRLAINGLHPPFGMEVGRRAVEDQAVVQDDRDPACMTAVDDLLDDVPPLEVLVLSADLRRVVEQPDVRHRISDDRLGACLHQHGDILAGVKPRQERIVPIGECMSMTARR